MDDGQFDPLIGKERKLIWSGNWDLSLRSSNPGDLSRSWRGRAPEDKDNNYNNKN